MRRETLGALIAARAKREALVLATPLAGGDEEIIHEDAVPADHPHAHAIAECFRTGHSRTVETDAGEIFLQVFLPRPRLLIIGATHIGQVVVRLAREVEIDSYVIDPRTAFATEQRFAGSELIAEWPGAALERLGIDRRCAMACLAHVPDIDDEALGLAMRSNCFYIGALGSTRSHAKRVDRLTAQGFTEEEIARISAPVGLDIGSVTPNEIALSIIAEVVKALRAPGKH